jgi:periplasmic protein TonB
MFEASPPQSRGYWRIVGSIAVHALVLFAIVHTVHRVRVRTFLPGTAAGTHIDLSYLPGGALPSLPQTQHPPALPKVKHSRPLPAPMPKPVPTPASETATTAPGKVNGPTNDALGNDDIRIALTTYSPSPKPDLSKLPRGTEGDVVLDVTIDPNGQVANLELLRKLGFGIDETVAEIVRTWKFNPATKDGVPVASVQEIHFHYGPV